MSIAGTVGRPIIVDIPACIHDGFIQLYDFKNSDAEFLYYTLQFLEKRIQSFGQSGTQTNVNTEIVGNVEIFHPSLPQQRRIAEILGTVDAEIEQTEALLAKCQRLKTGLLAELLTHGLDAQGQRRSPQTHEYKTVEGLTVPVEWEVKELGIVLNVIDCRHVTPKYVNEGFPVIRPRNIKIDGFDFNGIVYVTKSDYEFLMEKHLPKIGDIVFSRNASFGVSSFVEEFTQFAIGQDVVIMTSNIDKIDKFFIFQILNSEKLQAQILNESSGSTFGRINLKNLRKLKIQLPPYREQKVISEILQEFKLDVSSSQQRLQKLHALKRGLMQELLSGPEAQNGG